MEGAALSAAMDTGDGGTPQGDGKKGARGRAVGSQSEPRPGDRAKSTTPTKKGTFWGKAKLCASPDAAAGDDDNEEGEGDGDRSGSGVVARRALSFGSHDAPKIEEQKKKKGLLGRMWGKKAPTGGKT
jgi:hypothetical protein